MKKIPLTQGQVALIDDGDFEIVSLFKWIARKDKYSTFYAFTKVGIDKKQFYFSMHSLIMNTPSRKQVDHIDHYGLNNQRYNLRVCNHSQNQMNRGSNKNSSSIYKGVCWDKSQKRWLSRIRLNGKLINLGRFNNEEKAAKVYDEKAISLFGEFAKLNFTTKIRCPRMTHYDTTADTDVESFKGCPDCKGTLYITKTLKEVVNERLHPH